MIPRWETQFSYDDWNNSHNAAHINTHLHVHTFTLNMMIVGDDITTRNNYCNFDAIYTSYTHLIWMTNQQHQRQKQHQKPRWFIAVMKWWHFWDDDDVCLFRRNQAKTTTKKLPTFWMGPQVALVWSSHDPYFFIIISITYFSSLLLLPLQNIKKSWYNTNYILTDV